MSITKHRYQVWINDAILAGHVNADGDDGAMLLAELCVIGFYCGNIPEGTTWSVCKISPGYYKEIADMNQRAGFNILTDF